MMYIREASESDLDDVLRVERAAFGSDEEANLVRDLLSDRSAQPLLSLCAFEERLAVGHILFTHARLVPSANVSISLLAPLAVIADHQGKGIGGKLIEQGRGMLTRSGIDLIFVLGHPGYYPRHGFEPAGAFGFEATYPIASENLAAWMLLELSPGAAQAFRGKVICADALNRPEYWQE